MAGTYYLRGGITGNFFFEVRGVEALYFSVLRSFEGKEYISFDSNIINSDIITFSASRSGEAYIFSGEVAGRSFSLAVDEEGFLVPAKEGTPLLPLTEEVVNFSLFLAGVPFFLMRQPSNTPASFRIERPLGGIDSVNQVYVLPRDYYSPPSHLETFPAIIAIERNWFNGLKVAPAYTNKEDSSRDQLVAYNYCKDSLCAKPCKGGCLYSNQTCLTNTPGEANFICKAEAGVEVPYYKTATFIALAVTTGIALFLSIILLIFVVLLRK